MQSNSLRRGLYYTLLWLIAILFFLPVLWVVMAAFKTPNEILAVPPKFVYMPTLENIRRTLALPNTIPYFLHSLFLSIGSVLIAIAVSFFAAFALSRYKPRFTNFLMFLLLSTRMVPAAASVIPIFQMYNAFQWRNTFGILMLYTMFSIPFSLWILKGFIDGVSPRFDETGYVNGASRMHVMLRVVLPQVRPGLIAAFIFNLIFVWNEFLFNFVLAGPDTKTVPYALGVGLVNKGGDIDWAFIASLSSVYVVLPVIMIFLFQRYLLVGMTFGTVRGEV